MFHPTFTPSRLAQRLTRRQPADRVLVARVRSSLGETLAVGLGCDSWKPRQL